MDMRYSLWKYKYGDYVRTSDGEIGKLIRIEFDKIDNSLKWYVFWGKDEFGIEKELYINKPYIEKHSKNIIDLVEEGDYINGMQVEEFDDEDGNLFLGFPIYDDSLMNCIDEVRPLSTVQIKSIVTHQSFKQIEYEV